MIPKPNVLLLSCRVMSKHPEVVEAAQADIQAFHARVSS
jgi:hypothetical protein